jgi:serine/tyrosine/threonine adenylyltransferase
LFHFVKLDVKIHNMTAQIHGIAIHPTKYSTLGSAFQTPVQPQALPVPYWVCRNAALAREIGLNDEWLSNQELLETLTGNHVPTGLQPTASVYSGNWEMGGL